MKKNAANKTGFTLIELLIVVLIIGVLTAVALPGYRKSVEKSRVTDALTTMQAVAKSEHSWYLMNNDYTKDFANLDIDLIDVDGEKAEGASYDTVNYTFTLQDNSIMAQRSNGEYTLYKMYEDPNIYCLPQDHYICQQFGWGVNRSLCNNIEGAWSNKNQACYNTPQERCAATADPDDENPATWHTNNGGFCGFSENDVMVEEFQKCISYTYCNNSTFTGEGAECTATNNNACRNSYFYQGAVCRTKGGRFGNNAGCAYSTFTTGAICSAEEVYACYGVTIKDGSQCIAYKSVACEAAIIEDGGKCIIAAGGGGGRVCNGTYKGTGCCEGAGCQWFTPKCNCPIDEETGMHLTSC